MGFVWEAQHVLTHKLVALKFLKGAKDDDRRRFQREVRASSAARHPNVIDVQDILELPNGTLAMVMELLDGETLRTILEREGKIALPDLAAILVPVLAALEAAHAAGVIHRDLKPDNIFLCQRQDGVVTVKVLDFGVAKLTAQDGLAARTQALTGTGSMVGTPYYMSPEQVFSEKDIDSRADFWSLGVLLYECLTGRRPTEAENVGRVLKRIMTADFTPIAEQCEGLPDDVAALVMSMLAADRDARPKTIGEIKDVLARHAADVVRPFERPAENAPAGEGRTTVRIETADGEARTEVSAEPALERMARAETHRGVSLAAPAPSKRARYTLVAALAVVAGGAVLGLRFVRDPSRSVASSVPASSEVTALATSSAIAPATATGSVAATNSAVVAAAEPPASTPSVSVAPPARPVLRPNAAANVKASSSAKTADPPPPNVVAAPPASASASAPKLGIARNPKD